MVRLFDGDEVVGVVKYTDNLDFYDGRNYSCGGVGRHLGIGKLKNGKWYVCYGTQWQGERDYAEVISESTAKKLCLQHNPDIYETLFDEKPEILSE